MSQQCRSPYIVKYHDCVFHADAYWLPAVTFSAMFLMLSPVDLSSLAAALRVEKYTVRQFIYAFNELFESTSGPSVPAHACRQYPVVSTPNCLPWIARTSTPPG